MRNLFFFLTKNLLNLLYSSFPRFFNPEILIHEKIYLKGNSPLKVTTSKSNKQIRFLLLFGIITFLSTFSLKAQVYNLSLTMSTEKNSVLLGDTVKFKVIVHNIAKTTVTGVSVSFPLPVSVNFVSAVPSTGFYNASTGNWTIGQIDGTTDSITLDLNVSIKSDGVTYATAEISKMDQTDVNSIPGNGSLIEDDISSACVSVPMHFNCSENISILASAPAGFSNYQWYKNGTPISGATLDTLRIVDTGSYNYTAIVPGANCPASLCCPIKVIKDACQSLGDLVFNDANNNGIHDVNEFGIQGLQLSLFTVGIDGIRGTADDSLVNVTTTDANGKYLFTGLDNGIYYVKFIAPTNMLSSTGNGITDISGSGFFEPSFSNTNDEDHGTLMAGTKMILSNPIKLTLNANPVNDGDTDANTNLSIDFGVYKPTLPNCAGKLIIGNLIWLDENNNGIVDNGEKGYPGVNILLHLANKNNNGILVDSVIANTVSDSLGAYYFYCLDPGTYYVSIKAPVGTYSSTGNGINSKNAHGIFEPAPIGSDDNTDKGTSIGGDVIRTDTFSLSNLNNPSLFGLANLNIDFGLYKPKCTTAQPDFTFQASCLNSPVSITPIANNYLSYWWNLGDNILTNDSTTFNHLYTAPGNYVVQYSVLDSNLCSGSINHIVNVQTNILANAGLDKTICQGDSVQLGAKGGSHYKWSVLGQTSIFSPIVNPIVSPTVNTTYVVAVSNDFGCTSYDTVVVNVNQPPVVISPVTPLSTCAGVTVPVTITLDQPIANYVILGSAGYKDVVISGTTIKFNAILNGLYDNITVKLSNANGCSVSKTFPLYAAGNPESDFVVIEPYCVENETTLLYTGISTPGAVLTYNIGKDGVITYQSPATATSPAGDTTIVKWANWGSKVISLSVNDGGCKDVKTESIFVRKSPKTVLANKDTTVCPNTSIQLYGTANLLNSYYEWTTSTDSSLSAYDIANPIATPTITTTYTLTIMDDNGCRGEKSVTITVDSPKPVFNGVPANITVECGNIPLPAIVIATVNGVVLNNITFAENKTAGNCANNYSIIRTWTASNACGLVSKATQIITVKDTIPPVFANVPQNLTLNCGDSIPIAVQPNATDDCSGNAITIVYVQTTKDSTCVGNKTIIRTWIATDACGNTSSVAQSIKIIDNSPPVFTNVPPQVTIECGDTLPTAQPTASDACSSVTLTSKDSVNVINNCNKVITRTWTATDACGNVSTATQIINVFDTKPPVFGFIPVSVTVSCDANIPNAPQTLPSATDNCDPTPKVTFSETRDNAGTCLAHITRTWVATDQCSNTTKAVQIITIKDTVAPVITPVQPLLVGHVSGDTISMSCDNIIALDSSAVTAADNCNLAFIKFVNLGNKRGVCSRDGYSLLIGNSWEATDKCGNKSVYIIYIKIIDNKPPVLSAAPSNITVNNESDIPPAATLTATDNCTLNVPIVETEAKVSIGINCDYVLTRTWTATDSCGNFVNATQQILVHKNITVNTVPIAESCTRNDGSISVSPSNGTYVWSDGATGSTHLNLKAGTYSVTATFGDCVKIISVNVGDSCKIPPPAPCINPVATTLKTDATCGAANGTATINVDSIANYTYTWSVNSPVGSGNSRIGLLSGIYSVTVSRTNSATCFSVVTFTIANNASNCCTSFIAQTSVIKTLNDCAAKADVCVEIPVTVINTYTITDNGTPYSNGFDTCNSGSALHLFAGDHNLIFTTPTGCKDTLAVKVVCATPKTPISIQRSLTVGQTIPYCPTVTELGLSGTITSITNTCNGTGNAKFAFDTISKCLVIMGNSSGIDSACLKITTSTGDSNTVSLLVTVTPKQSVCTPFLTSHTATVYNRCVNDSAKICVDISLENIPDYNITINGTNYTSTFEGCKYDTITSYQYYVIPGRGTNGPYRLDFWACNGDTIRNKLFSDITNLIDYMNVWDPSGKWALIPSQLTIKGGNNTKTYGNMQVTQLSTLSYSTMQFNREYVPRATYLTIKSGLSKIVFANTTIGCSDTLTTNITCFAPTHANMSLNVGTKDSLSLSTTHLRGTIYNVAILQPGSGQFAQFSVIPGTTRITIESKGVGTDVASFVITDEFGIHDTTFITVTVLELATATRNPKAVDDVATTEKGKPILIDVLANDSISGNITLKIINPPAHGELTLTSDSKVIYSPTGEYCSGTNTDKFVYQICNSSGCDMAIVNVTVVCDKIKIYNGFSPNGDGVNDYFTIEGIEKYPNNVLTIYNRFGTQVYTVKSYKNDWDGTWNNKQLPNGTYFYQFIDGEGNVVNGYVQLER